jgi:glucose/arabinose dehydrogenase
MTLPRRGSVVALLAVVAVTAAACSGSGPSSSSPGKSTAAPASASPAGSPSPPAPAGRSSTPLIVPASERGGALSATHTLTVPAGWTARVWARVPGARMEAWTPEGDLLVSAPGDGKIVELRPDAAGTATVKTLLSGLTGPQGMAFARLNGGWVLYVAESDEIDRYPWGSGGISGARTVIAARLPDLDPSGDDVHSAKDVTVAADGTVYFNVGSSSNANPDDRTMSPQRAVIMAVSPTGSGLRVVERGVRNGEGLAVAPDGTVWTAVNERDNIPDQDNNHPAGSLADVPLVPDAITNAGGTKMNCSALAPINVGLPAHTAPLGMTFLEGSKIPAPWSGGAVIAGHGSWNRQPPRAPAVLWLAWNAAKRTLEPAVTMIGGFENADGSYWGRPVDAVPGPDGALYVSDDTAGAVYRLAPPA